MTLFEILKFNRELIERLIVAGMKPDDVRFIDLFRDFTKLTEEGNKVSYSVAILADKYGVSERKVYSLIKRFRTDCKPGAV